MAPSSIVHQANEKQSPSSMMAWRVHEFGPPDVMRFERVLRPNPGPGEVLVKVEAAGVGPWDGWMSLPVKNVSLAEKVKRSKDDREEKNGTGPIHAGVQT
jgi:hypothetical protein